MGARCPPSIERHADVMYQGRLDVVCMQLLVLALGAWMRARWVAWTFWDDGIPAISHLEASGDTPS